MPLCISLLFIPDADPKLSVQKKCLNRKGKDKKKCKGRGGNYLFFEKNAILLKWFLKIQHKGAQSSWGVRHSWEGGPQHEPGPHCPIMRAYCALLPALVHGSLVKTRLFRSPPHPCPLSANPGFKSSG